jgi:NADH dehydrogenase FAD-containing subunit
LARNRVEVKLGERWPDPDSETIGEADLIIWATGGRGPALFAGARLTLDERGYLLVDDTLRSLDDPCILAAGDAATLATHPETPKSGVYAVREGPVLRDNLVRALARARGASGAVRADRRYRPQRRSLVLLNTGDGRAILSYGLLALEGRWVMRLKDRIDRRFMRRFQRLGER